MKFEMTVTMKDGKVFTRTVSTKRGDLFGILDAQRYFANMVPEFVPLADQKNIVSVLVTQH